MHFVYICRASICIVLTNLRRNSLQQHPEHLDAIAQANLLREVSCRVYHFVNTFPVSLSASPYRLLLHTLERLARIRVSRRV